MQGKPLVIDSGVNAAMKQFRRIGNDHIPGLDPVGLVFHNQIATAMDKVKEHPVGVQMEVAGGGAGGVGTCGVMHTKAGQIIIICFLIMGFYSAPPYSRIVHKKRRKVNYIMIYVGVK